MESLNKKHVFTCEALIKKVPLHYWDFSKTYALDRDNEETSVMLEKKRPFAITGEVVYCAIESKEHMQMLKMRIRDDLSGNILFLNVLGTEPFKYKMLDESPLNPMWLSIAVPEALSCPSADKNLKCAKKIDAVNSADSVTPAMLGGLKSGMDTYSRTGEAKLSLLIGNEATTVIQKYFCNSSDYLSAMRWAARGLRLDLAIKKVLLQNISLTSMFDGKHVIAGGFISYSDDYGCFSLMNPAVLSENIEKYKSYYVQYRQMKGFTQSEYKNAVINAAKQNGNNDYIPFNLLKKEQLPSFKTTARMLHHPAKWGEVEFARKRLLFDDLFYFAMKIEDNKPLATEKTEKMPKHDVMNQYIHSLPYALTNGQAEAIKTLGLRMENGDSVHTLIQGDVGTGKTCVAFSLMIKAAENGFQAALAAPYTTLAGQHYRDMKKIGDELGLTVVTLTSEMKASEKKKTLKMIESGEADIIIGTHSIFTEKVQYRNLGLVIQDEEHKFGVVHREAFIDKGIKGCHKITMSATPIPKSLAETVYGENTSIITITDKPAERLPVKTAVAHDYKKCASFIIKEVANGHQAYIVCPAIENNENSDVKIESIEEMEKVFRPMFDAVHVSMAVLTGKMKQDEKTEIMQAYTDGKIDVLMSTTVIEVGINVPNATVMLITGADRFGFSTLHQLRGRVGRGHEQAYCILETKDMNAKLDFLQQNTDGFKIAEKDLEMRGPGSLFGERQSGDNIFIDLMLSYPDWFRHIQELAKDVSVDERKTFLKTYEELFLPQN